MNSMRNFFLCMIPKLAKKKNLSLPLAPYSTTLPTSAFKEESKKKNCENAALKLFSK